MPRPVFRCCVAVLALVIAGLLPSVGRAQMLPPEACPFAGDRFAWAADYCMALNETDDEIVAGPCLDQELQRRFINACEAVTYYKQALCGLAIERGTYPGRMDACLADAAFVGPTVRRTTAEAAARTPAA